MSMRLEGRIALITGGGSGIGRAIAHLFAEEGASVIVNDMVLEAACKTVEEMGSARERALAIQADVSQSAEVKAMFTLIAAQFETLDVLVNNAGIAETTGPRFDEVNRKAEARLGELMSGGPIRTHWDMTQDLTDEEWHRMIGVHLNGTFFCTREALKLMSPRNRGAIINMSSVAALMGIEVGSHYGAAKGGILSFTRSLAREVASRQIRVNAICPGWVDTPMTQVIPPLFRAFATSQIPLGRWAEPREIATAALFLASDESSYCTGQWLSPNGGLFTG
jgi:3-oxoacyl-[acyl-carrier protein] reductase